jgi:hypothetical protein
MVELEDVGLGGGRVYLLTIIPSKDSPRAAFLDEESCTAFQTMELAVAAANYAAAGINLTSREKYLDEYKLPEDWQPLVFASGGEPYTATYLGFTYQIIWRHIWTEGSWLDKREAK